MAKTTKHRHQITTYQIKPKPKKLKDLSQSMPVTCPGYDVDASEDGCSIILCDCQICSSNKTEQLQFLIDEIASVEQIEIDKNSRVTIYQMFENIKEKIEQINNNEKVYTPWLNAKDSKSKEEQRL